ncbi:hypothetical protein Kfla_7038 [Kribbella flavida DSM 17836]|uniref:Lipoprotein n=1 Tax=Kribbella flavida (strain DSM 17836 / JCM 10339 / NBRC 14399) TaxID=479435 RepID=D2Q515_KRIFD|nr:hypothetical protein [Kribbella flavida]ADB36026.1 hypothetical protein Kfla_7038 [Kribbella flavida DSM 17836]
MTNSRKALSLVPVTALVLALAGCGAVTSPGADKSPESDGKSPLAEYLGEGFSGGSGGPRVAVRAVGGDQDSSEEQLAKQRKVEEATAACMRTAGFEYVAVPPEANPKSKFAEAFNLPPDQFAAQYGYGISTIDWAKPDAAQDDDPNTTIRNALSATAKKAYDKALNGELGTGGVVAVPADGGKVQAPKDAGCRGKAAESVYGKGEDRAADFDKFQSLFKDLEALRKRIESDQRVVDATAAWADCLADAGHAGYTKVDEPRQKVSSKLDELTGTSTTPKPGKNFTVAAPSLDKVDAAKLAELRSFEIELAKADQGCKAKVYDAPYQQAQVEHEKGFVEQHKAELEQYRDTMAER